MRIHHLIRLCRVYPHRPPRIRARSGASSTEGRLRPSEHKEVAAVQELPRHRASAWSHRPHLSDSPQLTRASDLQATEEGPTGKDLTLSWFTKRIQPLQHRDQLMFQYTGRDDPMRATKDNLSADNKEVVPFKSSYHVIFGRPTYHKFHARACYIYNKLKIPGPKGATYQRTMQRCLKDQIGRNVHAYVDDIAVMTRKGSDLISDLTETFENLRRFVSRLGEKALPLYKLLKKTDNFVWDEAADAALQGLKELLASPSILAAPEESEPMLLYLAATNRVISLVIVVERKEEGHEYGVQKPVYYISEIHFEATNNMAEYEALLHGLRIAKEIGIKHIICCGDSDLVAQQVAGTWNTRNSVMAAYRDEVDEIAKCFLGYEVKYVRHDDNTAADMLSKLGSGRKSIPPGIFWSIYGCPRQGR
ncbi:hypothetical protein QYE76_047236 [Lolium multiflorum]|uniref:RNase H type-1 domain-containing protein n=1 Tax=Lolium multiflorum TaxID=4521 RepID=A0AAD8X1S1_LOLMU|nr:hypothetical protein QYE76_047236 [Lolium multiflorum]